MRLVKILLIIGLLVFAGAYYFTKSNKPFEAAQWERKNDEQGEVAVGITPKNLSESRDWEFEIILSTHSVELDYDLTKAVKLIDDSGREYFPAGYDGPTGGHHMQGVLRFQAIKPWPKSITLLVENVGGINIRQFQWQLKN